FLSDNFSYASIPVATLPGPAKYAFIDEVLKISSDEACVSPLENFAIEVIKTIGISAIDVVLISCFADFLSKIKETNTDKVKIICKILNLKITTINKEAKMIIIR